MFLAPCFLTGLPELIRRRRFFLPRPNLSKSGPSEPLRAAPSRPCPCPARPPQPLSSVLLVLISPSGLDGADAAAAVRRVLDRRAALPEAPRCRRQRPRRRSRRNPPSALRRGLRVRRSGPAGTPNAARFLFAGWQTTAETGGRGGSGAGRCRNVLDAVFPPGHRAGVLLKRNVPGNSGEHRRKGVPCVCFVSWCCRVSVRRRLADSLSKFLHLLAGGSGCCFQKCAGPVAAYMSPYMIRISAATLPRLRTFLVLVVACFEAAPYCHARCLPYDKLCGYPLRVTSVIWVTCVLLPSRPYVSSFYRLVSRLARASRRSLRCRYHLP